MNTKIMAKQSELLIALLFALFALSFAGCSKQSDGTTPTQNDTDKKAPIVEGGIDSEIASLEQIGVKVQTTGTNELLITDGFPFAKDLKGGDVIEIAKVDGDMFTATTNSAVPTDLGGMVYGVAGGTFFGKCTASDGTRTLADALGNTWVFTHAGITFSVRLPGTTNYAYTVEAKNDGASIRFTDAGVLLNGFAVKPAN